ncbi:meiotic nuclear division protein 1 homolog isoform X2 [Dendrobates tinctorius]|uniref:meiotic nuclear division protein 1 homolog isoform X2 n=1 Tax=Dendrobates tinctorius TaxID=92724 RepID=UPI003CC9CB67
MSKKRGLSVEEKRTKMMEIFFESDVFQLKDLEKIAPKQKGITSMSVKDVLQSLVDDGMVDSERIGTSNYFWAFPSKALHARKRKLEMLESQTSEAVQKKKQLEQSVQKAKVGRQDTRAPDSETDPSFRTKPDFLDSELQIQCLEERTKLAEKLAALRQQREQFMTELEKYKECDPDVIDEIRKANQVAKEAVNRWTDNIFSVKSWAKKKFGFEESKIDKTFGIPEEFDYID